MTLHIYGAKDQPATRYWVALHRQLKSGRWRDNGFWVRCRRRAIRWCFNCKKRRWAGNLIIHVYYDGSYHFCRKGKGCKA